MTDDRPAARVASIRALAVLAEPPAPEHDEVARAIGLSGAPDAAEYADVFLFNLVPYSSVYLGEEGMIGGVAREAVAGFWRAVGQTPPAEPDHLTALLGLYAGLLEVEADLDRAERALAERSRAALVHEHLMPWVFSYLDRVEELAPPILREWARRANSVLQEEVAALPYLDDLSVTPPRCLDVGRSGVTDPRTTSTSDFIAALLAPVRSGFIVTRADLARIARASGVPLRAGERRYALEHLLQQDAAGILGGLAQEAHRQAAEHAARRWSGTAGETFSERARRSATLLEELALEAGEVAEALP